MLCDGVERLGDYKRGQKKKGKKTENKKLQHSKVIDDCGTVLL